MRFEDLLAGGADFSFPAARANGLSQTFYLQYLSAGGLADSGGIMTVNVDALQTVLQFYQDLAQAGLVSPDVLSYQTPDAYVAEFINRGQEPRAAVFALSNYLALLDGGNAGFQAAGIPTASGDSSTIRDGWLWVIVTPDSSRKALTARFLEWMMEPAFHAEFAASLFHLPAQPAILEASLPAAVDSQFIRDLLAKATRPLPEGEGGTAPRLIQEALTDVLQGDSNAADAAKRVVSQNAER